MPSLVNELTPAQRMWLVETFGHSGENDEPFLHPEVNVSSNPFPHDRRFSDAHMEPYHPEEGPPLSQDDNRNSIFRLASPTTPGMDGGPSIRGTTPASNERPISPARDARDEMLQYEPRAMFPSLQPSFHRSCSQSPDDKFIKRLGLLNNGNDKPSPNDGKVPIYPHIGEKLTWEQSFQNLQVYKNAYGDCNVPQKYRGNPKLGGWVNKQRKKKKNPSKYGKLNDNQIRAMEVLGFKWNVEHNVPS